MAGGTLTEANGILIRALRSALGAEADPKMAQGMQRYLKSEMPCLGLKSARRREIERALFAEHPLATSSAWHDTVLSLWRNAGYREERYSAIGLSGYNQYEEYQARETLRMYEEMITTGAWWDLVDAVAAATTVLTWASDDINYAAIVGAAAVVFAGVMRWSGCLPTSSPHRSATAKA